MKAEGVEPRIPDIFVSVPKDGFSGMYVKMKSTDPKAKLSAAQEKNTPAQEEWIPCLRLQKGWITPSQ
jgi:hypothetical protein